MKKIICIILQVLCIGTIMAQTFENYFENKTLRVDYIFSGNATQQYIFWTNFPKRHNGRDASITYPNCLWPVTGK